MPRKWIYPKQNSIDLLKSDERLSGVSELALSILFNRGYDTPDKAEKLLFGTLDDLHDTRLMKDAELAVDLLIEAIHKNRPIVVYGDYDCDGIISTFVMTDLLRQAGAKAEFYTNNRFTQGYGMMPSGVDAIIEKYPDTEVIVTVDNGIMAFEGVEYAKSKGLTVIVTDHHDPGSHLPVADAIVDPKREDDEYPFKGLCGAGVAFKLMLLLYWMMELPIQAVYESLDVVAVATVGDVVPLLDENRIFVQKGLELIRKEHRPVFRVFREITESNDITAHWTLGFTYVPMLNAIGRLDGDPRRAIEMFFVDDETVMHETIQYLVEINEERKQMTREQYAVAVEMLEAKGLKNVIVIYNESFHEGIVGLIAGRLKEEYNRPTFVFTKHNGVLKGSARSIDGFHLKKSFEVLQSHVLGGGGHAKAGGLSIAEDKLEGFERAMNELADEWLTEDDYIKKYLVDALIDARTVDLDVVDELKELEPFGEGFPKPILSLRNFHGNKVFYMGQDKNHVKVVGNNVSLIMWGQAEQFQERGAPLAVKSLGYPELNVYKNNVSLQFVVDGDNFIGA